MENSSSSGLGWLVSRMWPRWVEVRCLSSGRSMSARSTESGDMIRVDIRTWISTLQISTHPDIYTDIYTCPHEYLQISTRISTIFIMYTHPHRVVVAEDCFSVHGLPHHITTAHYWRVSRLSLSSAPVPSVPVCHCTDILKADWKLASCALLPL